MSLLLRALVVTLPLLVVAGGAAAGPQQQTALQAIVGPGFSITLMKDGAKVTSLEPGTYVINVDDRSSSHNFHLAGPGVDQRTAVSFVGQQTWTVDLQAGTYTYVCDPHAESMRGAFAVETAPPPDTPPATQVKRLRASVGPGKTITLRTGAGAKVRTLEAGRYRIIVRDRSARDNVHLIGPRVNRKTGVRFRGTVRWTVRLRVGTYRYRSDATKRLRGRFRVVAATLHAHG